jgi:hypothetical protein
MAEPTEGPALPADCAEAGRFFSRTGVAADAISLQGGHRANQTHVMTGGQNSRFV